jgi:hypothetical protein
MGQSLFKLLRCFLAFVVFVFHHSPLRRSHPVSGNGNKKNGPKGNSGSDSDIAAPPRNIAVKIPQPFTVRQESTSEDNDRYGDQKSNRDAVLRAANRLNRITIVGTLIPVLSLCAVYLTLRQTDRSMRIDQRAWLSAYNPHERKAEGFLHLIANVQNTGKTPAMRVHNRIQATSIKTHIPCKVILAQFQPSTHPSSTVTFPGDKSGEVETRYPLSNSHAIAFLQGSETIELCGVIDYFDIFEGQHTTTFCYMLSKIEGENFDAVDCDEDNDAT